MSGTGAVVRAAGGWYFIECPACRRAHGWPGTWSWNGDVVSPTLEPELREQDATMVCNSFIHDGLIQFLSSCTHALAGRTVPLPPV